MTYAGEATGQEPADRPGPGRLLSLGHVDGLVVEREAIRNRGVVLVDVKRELVQRRNFGDLRCLVRGVSFHGSPKGS